MSADYILNFIRQPADQIITITEPYLSHNMNDNELFSEQDTVFKDDWDTVDPLE